MDTPPTSTSVSPSSAEGLALVCTPDGAVTRVVATLEGAPIAASFCDSVDESGAEACRVFLRSLARGGFARSTPLRIATRDVHCFGLGDATGLRIVGVIDPAAAATLAESLDDFGPLAEEIRRTHSTYQLYEELARLNNDLVTAQRELARTVAELQRLNAYKDELLGMAAHDLRNPLAANSAYIDFLLHDVEGMSEDNLTLLERLRGNSQYMLRLVENVLDFAAIQSGRVHLQLQESSIAEIVTGVLDTMRIISVGKDVSIAYTTDGELPPLRLDRVKITQAVQNLVSNAVQYSPAGAPVEVRLHPCPGGVEIEVEDHGPGIPAEELPQLFKPFTRLSTVSLSKQRSVGLGLAITRRLVEAHGGTIDVRSEVGKGSTFVVRLRA
ncbi:MAG TPA: HAMP domain-containing sensor histidine kinase [Thermoanaerobaculia bacterium]|jgi:signal transduction histidine kinase